MANLRIILHGKEISTIRLEAGQEYIFGRGDGCSVRLQDQPGISRHHFKLSMENGIWIASVVSKFGELIFGGQPVPSIELSEGSVFKLGNYDFRFFEHEEAKSVAIESPDLRIAVGAEHSSSIPAINGTLSLLPQIFSPSEFQGNDEATNVGTVLPAKPSLRIVKSDGSESRVELSGKRWVAGREDTCDIFLPDRKASRRQFEMSSTQDGYFIVDLGSANGTTLNGKPLIPDDPRVIRSGDVIAVQSLLLYFEIRDPSFEKRLVAIPHEVMAAPVMLPVPRFEIVNYPVVQDGGGGGALRLGGASFSSKGKPNLLRLILILIIVVAGLYTAFGEKENSSTSPSLNGSEKIDAVARLTPAQKQLTKELYVTARNLYMQGKFENADQQLKKLHEILPEGYEQSKAMAEDCLAQRANAEQLSFLEQERKRNDEQKRLIDRNVQQCNLLANTSFDVNQIRSCLAPTIGLDPTNPLVADLIGRVERRASERNLRVETQRNYAERVVRGKELFSKASSLQKRSQWQPAIESYERHIRSDLPDPDNLKSKSQAAIVEIQNLISSRVDELLKVAQSAYQAQNYKEALEAAKKAKEFAPNNDKAIDFIGRVRRELTAQLRVMYEDAILDEGVGRVQFAQAKWKQIMEKDTPDGEYYQKSRIKLRNYSEQMP